MPSTPRTLISAAQRQQVMTALSQFYAQPVARVSLELFITVIAVLFFAVFAIRPTLLTMSDLIKEIDEKRLLDKNLTQKIAALNTAQSMYLNMQDRLVVLDEAIPNSPQVVTAFKILEKIASDRNLPINALTLNDVPEDSPPTASTMDLTRRNVMVTMTVTGDYPSIRQLIEDIRQSQRSFVVESVTFATSDLRGAKILRCTINLNIPYFGQPETKEPVKK